MEHRQEGQNGGHADVDRHPLRKHAAQESAQCPAASDAQEIGKVVCQRMKLEPHRVGRQRKAFVENLGRKSFGEAFRCAYPRAR